MAAAYAALVSLMHTLEQIQRRTRLPTSFDKKQIESIHEKVCFLINFLEGYSHGGNKKAEDMESRIADAAYEIEDMIESQIVDHILAVSTGHKETTSIFFCTGLEKVIEDMDFIAKEAMKVKERGRMKDQPLMIPTPVGSSTIGTNTIVGFDDKLYQLMEQLTEQYSIRWIISIVGMGGIGKTTLTKNVYKNKVIVKHFDIRVWVTISQEYNVREILLEILFCQGKQGENENFEKSGNETSQTSEYHQLGEQLYKSLWGRRYLVVMDDMWDIEVWDKINRFFPDNSNGSRIVITTRQSNMAVQLNSCVLKMDFLDEDKSWNLFCEKVFAQKSCPLELEEIGKKIVNNCKGLPLSIVVIAGLLAKSKTTRENWEYVEKDVNSIINLEDDEYYMKILSLSYNHLPMHLKPCFLYMGVFPEDNKIRVSSLIKLWVAEGFLKPDGAKNLEEVGEEYLKDLISRSLVLIERWGSRGNIKVCNIHDVLRDMCIREAQKQKFIYIPKVHDLDTLQGLNSQRRVIIHRSISVQEYFPQVFNALRSKTFARSLIGYFDAPLPLSKLLRVLKMEDIFYGVERKHKYSLNTISQLINSRYLAFNGQWNSNSIFPNSMSLLRNLQTLIVKDTRGQTIATSEIWEMSQLRHLEFDKLYLPDPPRGQVNGKDDLVLVNLQTLLRVENFMCSEEMVKRIPNINKLRISYGDISCGFEEYSLKNLGCLHKLESLTCFFLSEKPPNRTNLLQNIAFPRSLKKLTLQDCGLHWEDMTMIGSLPHLEVLKLESGSFKGSEWKPVEGQFCCLKYLLINKCSDLEDWMANDTHFPCLEHLYLSHLDKLKEIPLGIGDIPTLKSVTMIYCSDFAVFSAKKILEEQEELGNVGLQFFVYVLDNIELESLGCHNFQVQSW